MKKISKTICTLLSIAFVFQLSVFAQSTIAYSSLDILRDELTLEKCATLQAPLVFTDADFENALGTELEYITITALPDPSVGVLKFAGNDVYENQSIIRKNISLLKFVPTTKSSERTEFGFSGIGGDVSCSATCSISVLDTENEAPISRNGSFEAFSGIQLSERLPCSDFEGDALTVEILSYPKNGLLRINGESFTYTSQANFEGKDSFSYRVSDVFGNLSAESEVTLSVSTPATKVRYDDMNTHWGYTSAIAMTELGLMGGKSEGDKLLFCPEQEISRGDFLAMAMIICGYEENISLGSVSAFADDKNIPHNIKSYASYAQSVGIVSGYESAAGQIFGSTQSITRAEAASMISRMLEEKGYDLLPIDYADIDAPAFAKKCMGQLLSIGIINGDTNGNLMADSKMTRAMASKMLTNLSEYVEKTEQAKEEKGFFAKILDFFKGE